MEFMRARRTRRASTAIPLVLKFENTKFFNGEVAIMSVFVGVGEKHFEQLQLFKDDIFFDV